MTQWLTPASSEVPEQGLEVGGLGRRPRRVHLPAGAAVFDRPDEAGRGAGRAQDLIEDVGRRRLALGPGDADDLHAVGRVAVEVRRGQGQGLAGVGDPDPRRVHGRRFRPGGQDGRGAVRRRLGHEVHAVAGRPGQGGEEEPRLDRLRIVGDAGDLLDRGAAEGDDRDAVEDVLELHGLLPRFDLGRQDLRRQGPFRGDPEIAQDLAGDVLEHGRAGLAAVVAVVGLVEDDDHGQARPVERGEPDEGGGVGPRVSRRDRRYPTSGPSPSSPRRRTRRAGSPCPCPPRRRG